MITTRIILAALLAIGGCAINGSASGGCASDRPRVATIGDLVTAATTEPTPMSIDAARAELDVLGRLPKARLERPLLICGGFLDVGVGPWLMKRTLSRYLDGPIVTSSFFTMLSFRGSRAWLAERIATTVGDRDVDVIGQSLGGLIAMHAALDDPTFGPRVRIRRLYTICSPLQGARLATITSFDVLPYQRDLRPGSALGRRLATTRLGYELISYARTRDDTVGEAYESLPGHPMILVDTPADEDAHDGADFDPRILLDLIRRLRGETPIRLETRP